MIGQVARPDLDDETQELLRRWSRWHDAGVVLGLIATVAAAAYG